MNDKYLNNKHQ